MSGIENKGKLAALTVFVGLASGCGGSGAAVESGGANGGVESAGPAASQELSARAPVARAGSDFAVNSRQAQLDGTGSTDSNGQKLTYQWNVVSRPKTSRTLFSDSKSSKPVFTTDKIGQYTLSLVVSNGRALSDVDYITINVKSLGNKKASSSNSAPSARAVSNIVTRSNKVQLDGSASRDVDGDKLYYTWRITGKPSGSNAGFNDSKISKPLLLTDKPGNYTVSLTVSDAKSNSQPARVAVRYQPNGAVAPKPTPKPVLPPIQEESVTKPTPKPANRAPVANAGGDIATRTARIKLVGQGADLDGDRLSYRWNLISKPSNSRISVSNYANQNLGLTLDVAGNYRFTLTSTDGKAWSKPDGVTVSYKPVASKPVTPKPITPTPKPTNRAPIASAGADIKVSKSNVVLDGSRSVDADSDRLTYAWTLTSKPAGSQATFYDYRVAKPTFRADVAGNYTAKLVVNDGKVSSKADFVTVRYQPPAPVDKPPVANAGPDITVSKSSVVLDGSRSKDPEGKQLGYQWLVLEKPKDSVASLNSQTSRTPTLRLDKRGIYRVRLIVSANGVKSKADVMVVRYEPPVAQPPVTKPTQPPSSGSRVYDFSQNSKGIVGAITNNARDLPDVKQVGGRYQANLTNNTDDVTLHFKRDQGRLDAWKVRFPFEVIASNIGIAPIGKPTGVHGYKTNAFNFAGLQVHTLNLNSPNSSHLVVGHRGGEAQFTIEGKNTLNGQSSVNDIGTGVAPKGRADLRIVGDKNGVLRAYWRRPGASKWIAYGRKEGAFPGAAPVYGKAGSEVYVGLITYAYGNVAVPFMGTCDKVEIIQK